MAIIVNTPGYSRKKNLPKDQRLPKDEGIQIMGIIAIFIPGIFGITLAILTIIFANQALRAYEINPELYLDSSLRKVKIGKKCAIASFFILGLIFLIFIGIIILYAASHGQHYP